MALLALLNEKMTSGDGRVYYGRAVTYRQLAGWFRTIHGRAPCERTLRNWIRALERSRSIVARKARLNQGLKIFVVSPMKHFRLAEDRPRQMTLFNEPVQMPVEKPVERLRNSQTEVRQKLAGWSGKKLPEKEVLLTKENLTSQSGAGAPPPARPVKNQPEARPTRPARHTQGGNPSGRQNRIAQLEEFYSLRKLLNEMPTGHPRYRELLARWQRLRDRIDGETLRQSMLRRREAG
jgi:hypothetical protein